MEDPENGATGLASPFIGLVFPLKAMATGDLNPDNGTRVHMAPYPMREETLLLGRARVLVGVWFSSD